jgi:penicillin-binding protein 2
MNDGRMVNKPAFQAWRMGVIYILAIFVLTFFIIRLFSLQIISGKEYADRANSNRTANISVPAQRGIIYDRNGFVLARNVASYNVTITPASLPADDGATQEVFRKLSDLLGISVNKGNTDDETVKTIWVLHRSFILAIPMHLMTR